MAVDRRTVSNAIKARLADQISWINGVEVAERTLAPPCIVVDPIQGGTLTSMISAVETVAQGSLPYQLTCVGVAGSEGREQSEFMATKAIEALVGWTTTEVQLVQVDAWGNARPDHDVDPPVWIAQPMIRVTARSS